MISCDKHKHCSYSLCRQNTSPTFIQTESLLWVSIGTEVIQYPSIRDDITDPGCDVSSDWPIIEGSFGSLHLIDLLHQCVW